MILRPSDEKVEFDLAFSSEIEPERSKKGLFKGQLIKLVQKETNFIVQQMILLVIIPLLYLKVLNLFLKILNHNFMKF
jgi:hypothetical protein